ncbi:hypothetical protein SLEP1_g52336 [Rubroshorea leprosula]|uniref:Disease resistance RPP13-like protein 1 n=1 Tax=Rubroshorea leprosula TaxID=152421 RepID=A0AAV5M8K5_9ROSI|nr:hypothetical protein SLEP1_g52336 [Rubroshorea leprosula]
MEVLSMVAEPLLSATFEWMIQKLNGFISSNSQGLQEEVHAGLEKWRTLLPQIRGLLRDAEEKQLHENFVKTWLDDLKDLAYDMEDIFEEFKVGVNDQRSTLIAKPQQATSSKFIPTTCFSCFKGNNFMFDSQTISKVKDISKRLKILDDTSKSLGLVNLGVQAGERPNRVDAVRITTCLPDPYVFGRESDKADILRELLADGGSDKGYSVIPIVGMGGVGKTTLARFIYNEVGGSFDPKVWVCVSDQFNILSITGSILKAVSNDQCDLKDLSLSQLQDKLKEKLSYKKFLLVLDDVWNEGSVPWDTLQKPFQFGSAGSKIIVTTRNENVAKTMDRKAQIYRLKPLEFEQCLPILAQQALGEKNFGAHPNLKDVGEEIVKRCKGLPLVAKVMGGLLQRSLDLEYWKYIKNKMLNLQAQESGILPELMLSYHDLPSYLKQCFAYCALFPQDYPFKKDELVMLWMAEGLLWQKPGEQNRLEEIGHQYFCELLSRSFFEQSSGEYVMHDLIHDLAQFVAGRTCHNAHTMLEVDKKSKVKFEKVRYLSFHCGGYGISEKFEVLKEMKSLRTLILASPEACWRYLAKTVVLDMIPELRCLRALSLRGYYIRKLPDSIRDLKCLKYLDLSEIEIQSLPESIIFLLQLQTLLLFNCKSFSKFPVTIGKLINLHQLDIRGTDSLKEMPSGIANLKDLLTLGKFIVGKENGSIKLSDLENLSQLEGELSILDLQNVSNAHDAKKARLDKIDGLDWLLLQWTSDFDNSRNEDKEMQVLSWLKPHPNLKSLSIICYGGKEWPSWISCPSFSNLSYLKLCECRRSTSLPSLGQLPALKELIVEGMDAIETVDSKFYGHETFQSLEKLELRDMSAWKEWISTTGDGVGFSCLLELVIENCPKLIGQLPSQLSCVTNLVIRRCPELRCPSSSTSLQSLQKLNIEDCNVVLLNSMADLTSLTSLEIKRISGLVCLPKSFVESLIAVENVRIEECLELTCLWEEGAEVQNLARLEEMNIEGCPLLVSLTGKEQGLLPFNLKRLTLSNCKALESLTDVMMMKLDGSSSSNNMLRLESLSIYKCDSLKSLPNTTVKHLTINGCAKFESLPDGVLLQDNGDSNSNLESLTIEELPSLNSVGTGHLPASLKEFIVYDWKRLESFPERMLQHCTGLEFLRIGNCEVWRSLSLDGLSNLRYLYITKCAVLEFLPEMGLSLPNLRSLKIAVCPGLERIPDGGLPLNLTDLRLENCQNLNSLPNTMNELTSIQKLMIRDCPGIKSIPDGGFPPNLTNLELNGEHLKQPAVERSLRNLTSLQSFIIYDTCPGRDIVLPSSLTYLRIDNAKNLKSIPRGLLQNLNSLQFLRFWGCPKLRSLPRKGLPPSLGSLWIKGCPLLKRQRFEEKGEYWSLTRTIPVVTIDGDEVKPTLKLTL